MDLEKREMNKVTSDFSLNKNGFHIKNGVLVKFVPKEYKGSLGALVVPEGVREIGVNAFQQCDPGDNADDFCGVPGLYKVILPSTCTVLRSGAFFSCQDLREIEFSAKLEIIEDAAFSDCRNLTPFVEIPESQDYIPDFLYATGGLDNVQIPDQVKTIGEWAFYDDVKLEEVNFNKVRVIGIESFFKCSLSKGVTLPSTVKEVQSGAFGWTSPPFIKINSVDTKIASDAFDAVYTVKTIYIPKDFDIPKNLWGIDNPKDVKIIRN